MGPGENGEVDPPIAVTGEGERKPVIEPPPMLLLGFMPESWVGSVANEKGALAMTTPFYRGP
jgi:hypothetical protein